MKGAFLIILLISLLIVGVLVMKNLGGDEATETDGAVNKVETMKKAEDAAKGLKKKFNFEKRKLDKSE